MAMKIFQASWNEYLTPLSIATRTTREAYAKHEPRLTAITPRGSKPRLGATRSVTREPVEEGAVPLFHKPQMRTENS
ncbi:uncharacterized protein SETTUDRAFT_152874 [Exserohilum turcica Et28A]|uniref:Uncharacterized protein n=1 Tax=Exserohilum turcicum (strain 28A) TaxID=671987 RepID=R0J526_EXST2|nr:uncharacterized protein SETTUDRAFT_152874 [Exserohilum turcica Et28A]EOA91836.1 hypothetical protein SETTUDRAFT_152874 [Exserohilum turcica Et28A]